MKVSDLSHFKKILEQKLSPFYLIVGQEKAQAVEALIQAVKEPPKTITAEQFSQARFHEEVETLPFLSKHTFLHVQGIDQLKAGDLQALQAYIKRPNPWVYLLFSAEQSPSKSFFNSIEESGCVLVLVEEKPWEKEKHTLQWLNEEAFKVGIQWAPEAAKTLLKSIGEDRELLRREIEKLLCYIGKKKQVSLDDIHAISCPCNQETLWQLGEAIFRLNRPSALSIGKHFLEEGESLFPLLAQLRTQMRQGLEILMHFQRGGAQSVSNAFPYLKGGLLQKKIEEAQYYGEKRFKQALILLYESEIRAKNSNDEHLFLLELLIIKLT